MKKIVLLAFLFAQSALASQVNIEVVNQLSNKNFGLQMDLIFDQPTLRPNKYYSQISCFDQNGKYSKSDAQHMQICQGAALSCRIGNSFPSPWVVGVQDFAIDAVESEYGYSQEYKAFFNYVHFELVGSSVTLNVACSTGSEAIIKSSDISAILKQIGQIKN